MSTRTVVLALALLAGQARAAQVEIVAVMWQQDVSVQSKVDDFFKCLTTSSTFGSTWAQQFGLSKVSFKGVYVLPSACPAKAYLNGNLVTVLTDAFDQGLLPTPSAGGTSYLLYLPKGVQGYDAYSIPACQGTYCGVHQMEDYNGTTYDAALVPIDCPDCGSVQATLIGQHEAAEAIANMGTAQYEVGDACEGPSNETMLDCCGTQYPIQQLSSSKYMSDCQTITATGNMCWCAPLGGACAADADCCMAGNVCDSSSKKCTMPSPPDMATAPPDLAGNVDLSANADANANGNANDDGDANGHGGVGSGGGDPGASASGCACSFAASRPAGWPVLLAGVLLLLGARRRRV
jgi:MYXO-CTERM domain-containing protein